MPLLHVPSGQHTNSTGEVCSAVPSFLKFEAAVDLNRPDTKKAELLKQRLGFDPREVKYFKTTPLRIAAESTIAADDAEALSIINASKRVKRPLTADDVYIHKIEAASSRFVPDRYCFIGVSTLQNIVADAIDGFAFMTKHATGGWLSEGELPYGRTFAAQLEQQGNVVRALVQFYMLRDHRPNGSNAPSTDDIDKGLVGGTLFDVSCGLAYGGEERVVCDVCTRDLWDDECRHIPGTTIAMSPDDIAKQAARGVPEGRATYTMENFRCGEVSVVYDGAIPGAGTAFTRGLAAAPTQHKPTDTETPSGTTAAAVTPAAAEPPTEEPTMKYSKELKLSLGLKEDATDEQVEIALASLKTKAADFDKQATDLAAEKKRADEAEAEAFANTWSGKLPDSTIAKLKVLPKTQRDELAADLSANTKVADAAVTTPPIGGLAGTAAAAAPSKEQGAAWSESDEFWRQGFGVCDSPEEVNKYATRSPIEALNRCLGTKLGETPHSRMAVQHRTSFFGIKPQQTTAAGAAK